jgi:hypothetical protein
MQNISGKRSSDMTSIDTTPGMREIQAGEIDQVSGGFFPFIATGIALGILYCMADGTFDKAQPKPVMGDYPSGPHNAG